MTPDDHTAIATAAGTRVTEDGNDGAGRRGPRGPLRALPGPVRDLAGGEERGRPGRAGPQRGRQEHVRAGGVGLVPASAGADRLRRPGHQGGPPHRIRRAGLTYIPEGRGIFPGLSVVDNLRMATRQLGGRAERAGRHRAGRRDVPGARSAPAAAGLEPVRWRAADAGPGPGPGGRTRS